MASRVLWIWLALAAALVGCDNRPHREVIITSPPAQQQVVVTAPAAPSTIMDSSDLDLATIGDLLRSGRVQDAETLQATINNPDNALNNVDLDRDGNIDPITVAEAATATGKQFNLVANPATQVAVTVANINVNVTGSQVYVQAGYPSYVRGYDRDYYNYSVARDVAFMAWALSASRPVYVARPYASYSWYAPARHVYAPEVVTQRRTTYSTQTHVSPVQRSAPPSSFTQQAQATKVPSGFQPSAASRPAPTTNNLNDRATAQEFRARDTTQPVAKATGFGARPADPAPAAPPPVTQRSQSFAPPAPAAPPQARMAPPPPPAVAPPPPSRPSFSTAPAPGPRTAPSPPSGGGGFRPSFSSSSPSGPRTSPSKR